MPRCARRAPLLLGHGGLQRRLQRLRSLIEDVGSCKFSPAMCQVLGSYGEANPGVSASAAGCSSSSTASYHSASRSCCCVDASVAVAVVAPAVAVTGVGGCRNGDGILSADSGVRRVAAPELGLHMLRS